MNLEGEYTRKRLSKFICQELLYEYVTHKLDAFREQEVTEYLASCRDSQRELDNLNKGLRYTQGLATFTISPELVEALESFEPQWKKRLRAWTLWSSERGWKVLPYAVLLTALGFGLWLTKPWQEPVNQDVLLAEQIKIEPDLAAVSTTPQVPAPAVAAPAPTAAPAPVAVAGPTAPTQAEDEAQVGRGFLFRSELVVGDFINSWPAIRDKILALGGKAAGNVELGWLRNPRESYFHFSLPESNLNELEIFLSTFSPVRFSKDRHPRVMPEGQIRIIMTVKDGTPENEAPPETP